VQTLEELLGRSRIEKRSNSKEAGAAMNFMQDQQPQDESANVESIDSMNDTDPTFVSGEKKPQQKQLAMLLGLLTVAGGVIWFMYFRPGPGSADAAPPAGPDTVTTFLASGEQHMQLMRQTLQSTDKVVQRFRQYPTQTQVPLASLRTNPFRAELPSKDIRPEDEQSASAKRRREEERQAALAAVAGLRVQSIVYGGRQPAVLINSRMVREGQTVEGFTIDEVKPNAVIVRQGVYRFELTMER
jgi:hypothetical protein